MRSYSFRYVRSALKLRREFQGRRIQMTHRPEGSRPAPQRFWNRFKMRWENCRIGDGKTRQPGGGTGA